MTGEQLSQSIAAEWDRIAAALGLALAEFEAELLPLLRTLEERPEERVTIEAIVALFDRHAAARAILRERLARLQVTKGATRGLRLERGGAPVRYTRVPVLFGTSRAPTGSADPASRFGTGRADNSFGVVEVSIPDDHRMGALEKPRWFRLQFRADPERHVVVLGVEPLDRAAFTARCRTELARLPRKDVLLFVHGYNVTFEDAARRAAQVAYDLQFDGVPALYSWPSEGSAAKYLVDANNVTWAEPHFRDFLSLLREDTGADAVHVIAHSMGTRLLADALEKTTPPAAAAAGRLRQVVFAAPDIDADTFRNLSAAFPGKAERVTLYASSGDRALAASMQIQKYPRAGQSGQDLVIVPSVDTVDASTVETGLLGHSYFGDAGTLLSDLFYVIRNGTPPGERSRLREQRRYGNPYWEFKR
jgi:esterase/lipase superfamily enzyme